MEREEEAIVKVAAIGDQTNGLWYNVKLIIDRWLDPGGVQQQT